MELTPIESEGRRLTDEGFKLPWWFANEGNVLLWSAVMDLAAEIRHLKAELRQRTGPFCVRCGRPMTDDEIAAYGEPANCESCERALARQHGV